jgi:hypothetical protein
MIAYFILVHRYPQQFKRLFKAIHDPANHYVVHVDKSSGPELLHEVKLFLNDYPNAAILKSKKAIWGGYSLVSAELRGMAQLLEMDKNWSHFINLSGQDFPLKSQMFIREFLRRNAGKEYIQVLNQQENRPDTMNRVNEYCFEMFNHLYRTKLTRKFLKGVTPYIGTQWKIVSRRFCEYVCSARTARRYKNFYRHSFIADEGFFQTVMMNNDCHGEIVSDDMRMIDWIPDGDIKLRPRTFKSIDSVDLMASDKLFARKFDMFEDDSIFQALELHIQNPKQARRSKRVIPLELVANHTSGAPFGRDKLVQNELHL